MINDLEKSLIGSCLFNARYFHQLENRVQSIHFTDTRLSEIFRVIYEWYNKGNSNDLALIASEINKANNIQTDFNELRSFTTFSKPRNLELYVTEIIETYQKNMFHSYLSNAIIEVDENEDVNSIYSRLEDNFNTLQSGATQYDTHISNGITETLRAIENAANSETVTGVTTGYNDLDLLTSGWIATDVTILAARSGMGKSSFALNLLLNAALANEPCIFFSLEMSRQQVIQVLIAIMTGIDTDKMRSGRLTKDERLRLTDAAAKLYDLPIHIHCNAFRIDDIVAQTRIAKRKHGIKLFSVDYLGLIIASNQKQNPSDQIGEVCRKIKLMSSENDCNLSSLVLCQLNRDVEKRPNKRPMLSDLRSSGDIEATADMVITLYRDNYYNPDSLDDHTEVGIIKSRHGRLATLARKFKGRKFSEVEDDFFQPSNTDNQMPRMERMPVEDSPF